VLGDPRKAEKTNQAMSPDKQKYTNDNKTRTAEIVGISPRTLHNKLSGPARSSGIEERLRLAGEQLIHGKGPAARSRQEVLHGLLPDARG